MGALEAALTEAAGRLLQVAQIREQLAGWERTMTSLKAQAQTAQEQAARDERDRDMAHAELLRTREQEIVRADERRARAETEAAEIVVVVAALRAEVTAEREALAALKAEIVAEEKRHRGRLEEIRQQASAMAQAG